MSRLRRILRYVRSSSALKYVVVLVAGVAIVGFLDENSVWSHIRNRRNIDELQAEIKLYREQYERDRAQLRRLDADPKAMGIYFLSHKLSPPFLMPFPSQPG